MGRSSAFSCGERGLIPYLGDKSSTFFCFVRYKCRFFYEKCVIFLFYEPVLLRFCYTSDVNVLLWEWYLNLVFVEHMVNHFFGLCGKNDFLVNEYPHH